MNVEYSRKFIKQFKKAPYKIKFSFKKRLSIFISNPDNPYINKHPLSGKFQSYFSINITGDWRAIYIQMGNNLSDGIYFVAIGTHSQLYK